jgi:hypothetical protein
MENIWKTAIKNITIVSAAVKIMKIFLAEKNWEKFGVLFKILLDFLQTLIIHIGF